MKLGEYFLSSTALRRSPTRQVTFLAKGEDAQAQRVLAEVRAQLVFLDEDERTRAEREAHKYLAKEYGGAFAIPEKAIRAEEAFRVLALALRDADDPSVYLIDSADQLRRWIAAPAAVELFDQYLGFVAEEFPPKVTDGDFEKLVEEAAKKSLSDLLLERGCATILRWLPSLAARLGTSPTQM